MATRVARLFNLWYRYIDDLIVLNNKKFLDYLKEICPTQLTVKKANKSDHLANYLDLTFMIDSGGKLSRLYDKHDDFDLHIVNFPFPSSNTPSGPSYGAPSHVIGWTNFLLYNSIHGSSRNFQCFTGFVYYLSSSFWWVLSCYSILECYNLFFGVKLNIRALFYFGITFNMPPLAVNVICHLSKCLTVSSLVYILKD